MRMISTHALREEGDVGIGAFQDFLLISTHALREEGDLWGGTFRPRRSISTHALREEGDPVRFSIGVLAAIFLPTPSARRATGCVIVDSFSHV